MFEFILAVKQQAALTLEFNVHPITSYLLMRPEGVYFGRYLIVNFGAVVQLVA